MAVPSSSSPSVMLAIHEKNPAPIDIKTPLRKYISTFYASYSTSDFEEDLNRISSLRNSLTQLSTLSNTARREILLSYYHALLSISPRFPISPDPSHITTLTFTWYDAFKPSKKACQQNIHFEMAAVVFNVGAVYSQIGLAANRTDFEGLKVACNSFMTAAGAFAYLRDNESVKAGMGTNVTVDVKEECAGMLERLMLAQAQECFFEKVIMDGKPPGICSKLARQVSIYYEEAHNALSVPHLHQHFDRTWGSHLQLKTAQFNAEACYRAGLDLHVKENIGEEIARLRVGINFLSDAKKTAKGASQILLDAVTRLENNISRNLDRAIKENEHVYLMRVPAVDSLMSLPAASLVKSTPFGEILEVSTKCFFTNLMPESCTKALTRYMEMIDEIICSQSDKLQQQNELSRFKIKEMELPDSLLSLEGNFIVPLDIKENVEAVQAIGGFSGLEAELQELKDLRRVNQELLDQTEKLLQQEEIEDIGFRTTFGTQWTRPQSSTLTKNLHDRLSRFAENLKQAADSDLHILASIKDNSVILKMLDCKPIESSLPRLAKPLFSLDGNEAAAVTVLKQSLGNLESLCAQKDSLENMLREMKSKDDILPKLMASAAPFEEILKEEITKYDHICEKVSQNVNAQENLLVKIQMQNDDFISSFNVKDYKVSVEKSYQQIAAAVAKFREIKENVNEGLRFYITLQDAITNIKQLCSDFVMCRNLESQGMVEDLQRNSGVSVSSNSTSRSPLSQSNSSDAALNPISYPSFPDGPY